MLYKMDQTNSDKALLQFDLKSFQKPLIQHEQHNISRSENLERKWKTIINNIFYGLNTSNG